MNFRLGKLCSRGGVSSRSKREHKAQKNEPQAWTGKPKAQTSGACVWPVYSSLHHPEVQNPRKVTQIHICDRGSGLRGEDGGRGGENDGE